MSCIMMEIYTQTTQDWVCYLWKHIIDSVHNLALLLVDASMSLISFTHRPRPYSASQTRGDGRMISEERSSLDTLNVP